MSLTTARTLLRQARSVMVLTGAGISAESGIPTFRGAGGLWRNFRPEELATPEAFARDPKLVREWYQWRRGVIREAQPNAGHVALAELERRVPEYLLVTQNVDNLHERAGSSKVTHLHGSIFIDRCIECGREMTPVPEEHCACGGWLRPGVVWFGEPLPEAAWQQAAAAAQCEVLLVVGTSALVYPAAALIPQAQACGAKVIEVNLEETRVSDAVDVSLRGPSARILPELL
ncbi:MAG: NAD-dependent deacylase [Acidobacteria bacterium]|nr:NAD-dependent deacylase [Acidobacteriota bacterium]